MPTLLIQSDIDALSPFVSNGDTIAYYEYLESKGYDYATLALGVVRNDTAAGAAARQFAENVGRITNTNSSLSGTDWAELTQALMTLDFAERQALVANNGSAGELSYADIRNYHAIAFSTKNLPITAWTAYVPVEEGTGNWNDIISTANGGTLTQWLGGLGTSTPIIFGAMADLVEAVFSDQSPSGDYALWLEAMFFGEEMTYGGSALQAFASESAALSPYVISAPSGGVVMGGTDAGNVIINADDTVDAILIGYDGDDILQGNAGDDALYGGDGNDTLYGSDGEDIINGGGDADLLTYKTLGRGLYFDLDANTVNELDGMEKDDLKDTVTNVEIIEGTAFADVLVSTEQAATLIGGDGNDLYIINGDKDQAIVINDSDGVGRIVHNLVLNAYNSFIDTSPLPDLYDYDAGIFSVTAGANYYYYTATIDKVDNKAIFTYVVPGDESNHGVFLTIENFASTNVISEVFSFNEDESEIIFNYDLADDTTSGGDDTATGGSGNDAITADPQYSHATGGAGADTFILPGDRAHDFTVTDFDKGEGDLIDLTGFDAVVSSLTALDIADDGNGNAQFLLPQGGGDITITLEGVTYSAIDATYFLSNTLDYGAGSGFAGANDSVTGDTIYGSSGNDTVWANDGNDIAYGHTGHDVMYGWLGNDSFWGGHGSDSLYGDQGSDVLNGDFGNDSLWGGDGNDTLLGGTGDDYLLGDDGADGLYGDAGDDTVDGGSGDDWIESGDGDDILFGGLGVDGLVGGAGADIFLYTAINQSTVWNGDWIYDFEQGTDLIDLSAVATGISVIGTSSFNGLAAPQLRQYAAGSNTVLALDADGNGVADMELVLVGSYSFAQADLYA